MMTSVTGASTLVFYRPPGVWRDRLRSYRLVVDGSAVVNLYGAPGKTYRLQYKTNLDDPDWIDLPPDITSTNATISITNQIGDLSQRFYRIYRLP